MFYCNDCATKKGWPTSHIRSYGNCETCETTTNCSDVPSSFLGSLPEEWKKYYRGEPCMYDNPNWRKGVKKNG